MSQRMILVTVAPLLLLGACSPSLRSLSKVPQEGRRTVAFWSDAQGNGGPAPFQYSISEGFGSPEAVSYMCRLVTPDPDSVVRVLWEPNTPARYPGTRKAGTRHGRAAQRFAHAAGVDHVMYTYLNIEFETVVLQPAQSYSLFGKVVLGKRDTPAILGPAPRKAIFNLRYIDGYTGKTLWKMKKVSYSNADNYDRMAQAISRKFHRKFPFRRP